MSEVTPVSMKQQQRRQERHDKTEKLISNLTTQGKRLPSPIPEDFNFSTHLQLAMNQLRPVTFITKQTPNFIAPKPIVSTPESMSIFHRFIARTCQISSMNNKIKQQRIIKKAKLSKQANNEIAPQKQQFKVLVLCGSVTRVQDLEHSTENLAVCSVFGVHYKLEQHVRMMAYGGYKDCQVAICTVRRMAELLKKSCIEHEKVEKIVIDWSFLDKKNRCIFEHKEEGEAVAEICALCPDAQIYVL
ncbi:hypothetical protein SS50377_24116 [Spironucleus salmonicida]|uniref:Uncharacterized protein n=1 Tax=Spironucleus salmonicida TaxID=348837 RepID=V6LTI7_9EUKA|nr:hypothetical protein SS50377_24116 [Spironucleus salmonicida]|eukprot:EST44104.1 Hypothetical protein SS50377_16103 [Spironucleus salmonicida]